MRVNFVLPAGHVDGETGRNVTALTVDEVPRQGEGVYLPDGESGLGAPRGAVRYVVQSVTHYPRGRSGSPGRYVEVELG